MDLQNLFLLDPGVIFLNHGSFGATPRPVFEAYQAWQRRLEAQPVEFLGRELGEHLQAARQALAKYLGAPAEDLVFVPNATTGVNIVARSLPLRFGDEILASDHEYGACEKAWQFVCGKTGAVYRRQEISLPVRSPVEVVEILWQAVTKRTRVIFLSHMTSPTALRLPVEAICQRARAAGIWTVIDGAHAPGQIELDLPEVGADFYTGNCHKWLMSQPAKLHHPERIPHKQPGCHSPRQAWPPLGGSRQVACGRGNRYQHRPTPAPPCRRRHVCYPSAHWSGSGLPSAAQY